MPSGPLILGEQRFIRDTDEQIDLVADADVTLASFRENETQTNPLFVFKDNDDVETLSIRKGGKLRASEISKTLTVTTDTTAGVVTYTIAQLLGGLILRDPNGAGRSDVTPTAALVVAGMPGAKVGQSFEFVIRNTADADETITITAGTGATLSGTMTIAQNNSKRFVLRLDNVTASSEAYTLYSLGTLVH